MLILAQLVTNIDNFDYLDVGKILTLPIYIHLLVDIAHIIAADIAADIAAYIAKCDLPSCRVDIDSLSIYIHLLVDIAHSY